jgi:hypothetical protein
MTRSAMAKKYTALNSDSVAVKELTINDARHLDSRLRLFVCSGTQAKCILKECILNKRCSSSRETRAGHSRTAIDGP